MFLKTYKFVNMFLIFRDELLWLKEVCMKLIAWLPDVFKWRKWKISVQFFKLYKIYETLHSHAQLNKKFAEYFFELLLIFL